MRYLAVGLSATGCRGTHVSTVCAGRDSTTGAWIDSSHAATSASLARVPAAASRSSSIADAFAAVDRCTDAGELCRMLAEIVPEALAVDPMELAELVAQVVGEPVVAPAPTCASVTAATMRDEVLVSTPPARWPLAIVAFAIGAGLLCRHFW